MMMTMSDSSPSILKASEVKLSKKKRKIKDQSNVGRSCRNLQLANSLSSFVVAELHVSLKDTPVHPRKRPSFLRCEKKRKMTLADCEEDVIQICHLLLRNGIFFPTAPHQELSNSTKFDRHCQW